MDKLSTERIALVPKSKKLSIMELDQMKVQELKQIATTIITIDEFINNVRFDHPYDLSKFIPVKFDLKGDMHEVGIDLEEDDFSIELNYKWELHAVVKDKNLSIDLYNAYNGEGDHDYDNEFICTIGTVKLPC